MAVAVFPRKGITTERVIIILFTLFLLFRIVTTKIYLISPSRCSPRPLLAPPNSLILSQSAAHNLHPSIPSRDATSVLSAYFRLKQSLPRNLFSPSLPLSFIFILMYPTCCFLNL